MKFYEVQKYFTEVNYQFHPDPFYVNAAWWNGLPEEYRDIITECATKMGEYNDELIDKNSSAAKQTIVDSGCEVYEPSADELKAFQTAVQSVYDQCVTEGICTADEIKEIHNYGNAHPSGAADLFCRAGHPAGLRHRRFLCDLHSDLCTYLYYHAAAARVERCLQ